MFLELLDRYGPTLHTIHLHAKANATGRAFILNVFGENLSPRRIITALGPSAEVVAGFRRGRRPYVFSSAKKTTFCPIDSHTVCPQRP